MDSYRDHLLVLNELSDKTAFAAANKLSDKIDNAYEKGANIKSLKSPMRSVSKMELYGQNAIAGHPAHLRLKNTLYGRTNNNGVYKVAGKGMRTGSKLLRDNS